MKTTDRTYTHDFIAPKNILLDGEARMAHSSPSPFLERKPTANSAGWVFIQSFEKER